MIKELIYASRSDYGSWCYCNCADFRTQKLLKDWTNPKRTDYRKQVPDNAIFYCISSKEYSSLGLWLVKKLLPEKV